MIEPSSSSRKRDAYRAAHESRGEAFSKMVRRIFNRDVR